MATEKQKRFNDRIDLGERTHPGSVSDEKRIERRWTLFRPEDLNAWHLRANVNHDVRVIGVDLPGRTEVMPVDEHLDALGEAEKERDKSRERFWMRDGELLAKQRELDVAEGKLETLRSACKQWRRETEVLNARQGLVLVASDRALFDALDPSEDTEKQSDLRPRSAIALVAGHLEGYADGLDQMARLERTLDLVALAAALREDAEKLKQSGGGEDRG